MKIVRSQRVIVLHYLLQGKGITQRKAYAYWNIPRLSAIIFNLKKEGWNIKTEKIRNEVYRGIYTKYTLDLDNKINIDFV